MHPQALKLTIKLKIDKSANDSLPTVDHPSIVQHEPNASSDSNLPKKLPMNSNDKVDLSSTEEMGIHSTEGNEPNGNSQHQLVVLDPSVKGTNDTVETRVSQDSIGRRLSRPPLANQSTRVGAFTVQCSNCFKWRVVPTKEKYEEIREHFTEQPFVCEMGRVWRPEILCDDPPDIIQDGSRLWAIDKPNIAQPPHGWERLLSIRGEGSSKFADVYYVSPSGKKLRSMVEVQRYLNEYPEDIEDGVSLSRFSFQTPKPLRDNYVRKRSSQEALNDDMGANGISPVQPIAWASPDEDTDLQLSVPGLSADCSKSCGSTPKVKVKKSLKRSPSKRSCNADLGNIYNHSDVELGDSHQL